VAEIEGIGPERVGGILAATRAHLEQKRAEEAALAAAAASAALAAAAEVAAGDPEVEAVPAEVLVSEERGE